MTIQNTRIPGFYWVKLIPNTLSPKRVELKDGPDLGPSPQAPEWAGLVEWEPALLLASGAWFRVGESDPIEPHIIGARIDPEADRPPRDGIFIAPDGSGADVWHDGRHLGRARDAEELWFLSRKLAKLEPRRVTDKDREEIEAWLRNNEVTREAPKESARPELSRNDLIAKESKKIARQALQARRGAEWKLWSETEKERAVKKVLKKNPQIRKQAIEIVDSKMEMEDIEL